MQKRRATKLPLLELPPLPITGVRDRHALTGDQLGMLLALSIFPYRGLGVPRP